MLTKMDRMDPVEEMLKQSKIKLGLNADLEAQLSKIEYNSSDSDEDDEFDDDIFRQSAASLSQMKSSVGFKDSASQLSKKKKKKGAAVKSQKK